MCTRNGIATAGISRPVACGFARKFGMELQPSERQGVTTTSRCGSLSPDTVGRSRHARRSCRTVVPSTVASALTARCCCRRRCDRSSLRNGRPTDLSPSRTDARRHELLPVEGRSRFAGRRCRNAEPVQAGHLCRFLGGEQGRGSDGGDEITATRLRVFMDTQVGGSSVPGSSVTSPPQ